MAKVMCISSSYSEIFAIIEETSDFLSKTTTSNVSTSASFAAVFLIWSFFFLTENLSKRILGKNKSLQSFKNHYM